MNGLTKKWIKKGLCRNFAEYVAEQTGMTQEMILNSGKVKYSCPGITKAARYIVDAVQRNRHIEVVADYDADGIGSAAQIHMILKKLGAVNYRITIPKRMLDGYGINSRIIADIPDGSLVVTIDNGISANEAIREAKRRGMTVVVLDHHLRNGELPLADLIVDPEDNPEGWTSPYYCGAGLTYKLAEDLFPYETNFLDHLSAFAAISTIADSVYVLGDNRNIITRGLRNLNSRTCPEGLQAILDYLAQEKNMEHIGIGEINFKIAPIVNAPGRLSDDGGKKILRAFFQHGNRAQEYAKEIYDINEERKELVAKAQEMVETGEAGDCFLRKGKVIFLYIKDFQEGLCGILAGKLSGDDRRPAFVMTKDSHGDIKGSARSQSGVNVFEILKQASAMMLRFGGHAPAAGFSFKEENLEAVYEALEAAAPEVGSGEDVSWYDLEVLPMAVQSVHTGIAQIGVYGEGFPEPVLKITGPVDDAKAIGEEENHLSFRMAGVRYIAFRQYAKYLELGSPKILTVYGTVNSNWYKGRAYVQVNVMDFEAL